ncbi:thioredoxin family protein [Alicyclobacillus fastidiosus]|uniref:Thioredoxin family protein n=1 Tax=Alicyclobacillus fastidiosus TaxID=392011 RepID=A0ABV5AD59_9BACL|nr:thioredoxin family protein [Alicyclobacillus fastidiosus]WEH08763.1 thioredoxin family protein [Alicyclobacillus fastidiosus]
MGVNLVQKMGQGLSPEQFVANMTRNQEQFVQWYDQFAWPEGASRTFFENYRTPGVHCVIIAADWCGDVVRNIPVVFRLMEAAHIPTEVLIMEEHLETMDQFLTFGGRSIPVVLFLDGEGGVIGRWGPRPTYVQEPMVTFKSENPDREAPDYQDKLAVARQEIMRRYGTDTGYQRLIVEEIKQILQDI